MSDTQKTPYLQRLDRGVLLFDGAMGTMLYDRGVFVNRCFEETCLSRPELVSGIHEAMIDAGAQAITTNSFGANPVKLTGYGLQEKTAEINTASVRLAKDAAGADVYVAGSVGPLGQRLEPVGRISMERAQEAFALQMSTLLEAGVDLILLETFKNTDELLLAASVAKRLAPEIPVQAQFFLSSYQIENYADEARRIVDRLEESPHVDVVGMNCAVGPSFTLDILSGISGHTGKPVSAMPNAGFPKDVDGRQLYLASPDYFAEYALRFRDAGATVIGGCCGTTPEHIRKMGRMILNIDAGRRVSLRPATETTKVEHAQPVLLVEKSKLGAALAAGTWITSVELVPPVGIDLQRILEKADQLKRDDVTCINIPDGPRASSRISALITALEIERHTGVETILHVCCRDKNLIGMQADFLGSQASGLRNMLCVTGDPPKVGNYPDVTGVFDVDSVGLLSLANQLNHGLDLGGNELPAPTSLVLGAGLNPAAAAPETEIERAYMKAEAGVEFFITQPVFDAEQLIGFLEKVADTDVPVIAGVWPLASYRNALFLNNEVPGVTIPDPIMARMQAIESKEAAREEGIRISREITDAVRHLIRGIQVSPPFGRLKTALDVIAE
jgi:methionine synthase / methylenetetrahydrofolate reductase(NADPH)